MEDEYLILKKLSTLFMIFLIQLHIVILFMIDP